MKVFIQRRNIRINVQMIVRNGTPYGTPYDGNDDRLFTWKKLTKPHVCQTCHLHVWLQSPPSQENSAHGKFYDDNCG